MWELLWFVASVSCDALIIDNGIVLSTAAALDTSLNSQREIEDLTHVVETELGRVRGYEDDGIVQYFDIPYGAFGKDKPFQKPSKPQPWSSILQNTEHTSRCPQINSTDAYVGDNECLTISIFKPLNAENADVLFHIHDSYFHTGSGDPSTYGPGHLVPHGIILVLPNYRLGPLGFLCLQNETAPGNAGLKDLALALEWTANNINNFGGNSSKIVLSGSGAAGALVEYLLLSNISSPFISKAITDSGSALCPWALDRNPLETADSLIDRLIGAETRHYNSEQINNAFEQINVEELIRAANGINFGPCIELGEGFLTESPWNLLQEYNSNIPYMLGSANHAAMEKVLEHSTEESLSMFNNDPSLLLPNDLKFKDNRQKLEIGRLVKAQYFGDNNITLHDIKNLSQCFTDCKYGFPGIRGARMLGKGGATIYFYELSYGDMGPVSGAARGDFMDFVFSRDVGNTYTNGNGNRMQDIVTELWVNFIKTGEPSAEDLRWNSLKAVAETEEEWLSIGEEITSQKGFHINRLRLWNDIYEKYFIERNMSFELKPSIYVTLSCLILLLDINEMYKT